MAKKQKGGPPPKEKVVKKKSGCLAGVLLIILLIALLLFLMKHFKFGFFGDGDGDSSSGSGTSVSDTVDDKNLTETVVDVTVLGNEYLYDNGKIELPSLIDELKGMDGKINVHIKDDNAYQDTMQALIDELKKEGIAYTEPSGE